MMNHLLVAAIDFGTTFSGWAFSFKHDFERDPTKITAKNWHGDQLISQKAPTCVLIEPDGKTFDSFGYSAESKYAELVAEKKNEQWYFFRRFKMMLFDKLKISRKANIEDACGRQLPAKRVFSMVIKFLKDDLLQECSKQLGDSIKESEVKWVLTVPAIWNDVAKQFMREAAIEAGIINEHLLIALEPEAASIFCRHLPVDKANGDEQTSLASMRAGTKYMVLDAGGGTVDITFHQVIVDDKLREIHRASGGAWGGTRIDAEYKRFLASIFGSDVMKKFQDQNLDDYIDMMRAFEIKKRDMKPHDKAKVTIRIPPSLLDLVQESRGKHLKDILPESKFVKYIKFVSGKLRVDSELFISLFKETIAQIVQYTSSLLQEEKCRNCSTIVLAGGFAESLILQAAIRDAFKGFRLIVPNETGLVVLKGAVIFGHCPATIVERVCRYTYGLQDSHHTSKNCQHPPTETEEGKDGIMRCKNLFDINVRLDETVKLKEERSTGKRYRPRYDDTTSVGFTLYATENKDPSLTTEHGCFKLGKLSIPIKDTSHGRNRTFKCSIIFGDTEIAVKAVDEISSEVFLLSVNCLE